jgi:hypothetical protein
MKKLMYGHPSLFVSWLSIYKFYIGPSVLFALNIIISFISRQRVAPLSLAFAWMAVCIISYLLWKKHESRNKLVYERLEANIIPVVQDLAHKYGVQIGDNCIMLAVNRVNSTLFVDILLKISEKTSKVDSIKSELFQQLTRENPSLRYKIIVQYPLVKKKGKTKGEDFAHYVLT